jgi:hypothetical protein
MEQFLLLVSLSPCLRIFRKYPIPGWRRNPLLPPPPLRVYLLHAREGLLP